MTADHAGFVQVDRCWVCDGDSFRPIRQAPFDLRQYADEDPPLSRYSGAAVMMRWCRACGFGQPDALPALERYFDRLYSQRWSPEWMEGQYASPYKDIIFERVLEGLSSRLSLSARRLLDIGAHVGRLMMKAREAGWSPEGIELNPRTAAFASKATGLPVHQQDAAALVERGDRFDAITMLDVLEHIPRPVDMLKTARRLLAPGGWIAIKVPNGRMQIRKEIWRSRLAPGYCYRVGQNLVHVNQFDPSSLRTALDRAGFSDVRLELGAPELFVATSLAQRSSNALRLAVWRAGQAIPLGHRTPLALHLQAYARAH